jgi:hypothetical protein
MENTAFWPSNKHGTSWRRATLLFDWRDQDIVDEAIETVDPYKITVVRYRPVAAIGFKTIGDMVMHCLAGRLPPNRRFATEGMCAVIDPCTDTEALRALVEEEMDSSRFSIFGVAVLDFADQQTHGSLKTALAERRGQFAGEMPCIDF